MLRVFGIVNVTSDSFSDGGRFLAPDAALAHAQQLLADGADGIEVGAESTHPDAADVPATEECARLLPVVEALRARGVCISVDTRKPGVMQAMIVAGVAFVNDVDGFRTAAAMAVVAAAPPSVRFIAMFSRTESGRAQRVDLDSTGGLSDVRAFCRERITAFAAVGVARERLVLDPGMGFFLGKTAAPSLEVLRHLRDLQREFGPLLVSVSRKSFLGEITGLPIGERGPATLAAELWAARQGVDWIRTHDVKAVRAAWAVELAIAGLPSGHDPRC